MCCITDYNKRILTNLDDFPTVSSGYMSRLVVSLQLKAALGLLTNQDNSVFFSRLLLHLMHLKLE